MNYALVRCIAIFILATTCAAQKIHPCKFSDTSYIGHAEGVTVQRLSVIEKSEKVGATVFIPDGNEPLPAIVFSHSAIHGLSNDTDLLRFAWALARAGAASIVLDGAINWRYGPNDDSICPLEFQFCAAQWLLQHLKVDLTRTAEAGNHQLTPTPDDDERVFSVWRWHTAWLDFGQTMDAASRNTDAMLTLKGQMINAQLAQRWLKLKEVKPEWLTETAQPLS